MTWKKGLIGDSSNLMIRHYQIASNQKEKQLKRVQKHSIFLNYIFWLSLGQFLKWARKQPNETKIIQCLLTIQILYQKGHCWAEVGFLKPPRITSIWFKGFFLIGFWGKWILSKSFEIPRSYSIGFLVRKIILTLIVLNIVICSYKGLRANSNVLKGVVSLELYYWCDYNTIYSSNILILTLTQLVWFQFPRF